MLGISEPGLIESGSAIHAAQMLVIVVRRSGRDRVPCHQVRQVGPYRATRRVPRIV